jgi:ABC-2 type transport system ATP-binding protein
MRQKVIIACGLVRTPLVLLFDEPLTGLDPIGMRRMRDTITRRAREGAAVLLSSHLLPLVQEVCTRVVIMHQGRKVADGSVRDLATRADLVDVGSSLEDIFLHVTGHQREPDPER